jgi:hypothetical protein
MVIKIPKFSIARHSKICKNLEFWYENGPSGNPAVKDEKRRKQQRSRVQPECNTPSEVGERISDQ